MTTLLSGSITSAGPAGFVIALHQFSGSGSIAAISPGALVEGASGAVAVFADTDTFTDAVFEAGNTEAEEAVLINTIQFCLTPAPDPGG